MEKKRILIFMPEIGTDGICKIISDYISNLNSVNDIEILTIKVKNNLYFDKKIKIIEIGKTKNIFKRFYREIKVLKNKKYDIIHINGNYCSRLIECISAKIAGVKKIIIHSHNDGADNNNIIKIILNNSLKKLFDYVADEYIACSDNAAKWMFSKKIYKSKKYKVIFNGINVEKFKYDDEMRKKIRKKLNITDEKIVIGFVGRLSFQKNPMFLLDILKEYKKINKNVLLLIIGEGELHENMIKTIKELKLEKNVLFIGSINNVNDYYNAMDCFILPSKYEGFGIVTIEAQTSGLITLLSDRVPKETKISPLTHYISLSTSINEWIKLINRNRNREEYYKFAIKSGFDIKKIAEKIEKLYR